MKKLLLFLGIFLLMLNVNALNNLTLDSTKYISGSYNNQKIIVHENRPYLLSRIPLSSDLRVTYLNNLSDFMGSWNTTIINNFTGTNLAYCSFDVFGHEQYAYVFQGVIGTSNAYYGYYDKGVSNTDYVHFGYLKSPIDIRLVGSSARWYMNNKAEQWIYNPWNSISFGAQNTETPCTTSRGVNNLISQNGNYLVYWNTTSTPNELFLMGITQKNKIDNCCAGAHAVEMKESDNYMYVTYVDPDKKEVWLMKTNRYNPTSFSYTKIIEWGVSNYALKVGLVIDSTNKPHIFVANGTASGHADVYHHYQNNSIWVNEKTPIVITLGSDSFACAIDENDIIYISKTQSPSSQFVAYKLTGDTKGQNQTYKTTFKIYNSIGLFPISNVSISIGKSFLNYTDIIYTDINGEAIFTVEEGEHYYYETYHKAYNSKDTQILTSTSMDWNETIFLDFNNTFTNFYVHVKDHYTANDIENARVAVFTEQQNFLDYTNSTGVIYFPYVRKGLINISITKSDYIDFLKIEYEIFEDEHHFFVYLMNESLWESNRYNVTINIKNNNSVNLANVGIEMTNLENGYSDFRYTNSTGDVLFENFFEGRFRAMITKAGYSTMSFTSDLRNNSHYNEIMQLAPINYELSVIINDKITHHPISNALIKLYIENCSGDFEYRRSRITASFGNANFGTVKQGASFYVDINHSEYAFFESSPYIMDMSKSLQFDLSSLYHTYPVIVHVQNTSGAPLSYSRIIVERDNIKLFDVDLGVNSQYAFDLKTDEKYKITASHQNYHTKSYTIQNHNQIQSIIINMTHKDEINPDNPFNIGTFDWSDLFGLIKSYGFYVFLLLIVIFVYRAITVKDSEPQYPPSWRERF